MSELLLDVKKQLCLLMLRSDQVLQSLNGLLGDAKLDVDLGPFAEFENEADQSKYDTLFLESLSLHERIEMVSARIAANPSWTAVTYPWLIEIHGSSIGDPNSVAVLFVQEELDGDLDSTLDSGDVDKAIQESAGQEYAAVIALLDKLQLVPIEQGASADEWSIAVPCTDFVAGNLCNALYAKFHEQIEYDLLLVKKVFWGMRIEDLWTVEDAIVFANKYNIERPDIETS